MVNERTHRVIPLTERDSGRPGPARWSTDRALPSPHRRATAHVAPGHRLPTRPRRRLPITGASWRSGDTTHPGWTASTVKLAIAADLLRRDRAHQITLSAADRHDLTTMLNSSDNAATDRLWKAYGGDAMLARFRSDFGMTGLRFVPGFTPRTYWGFVKCTSDDLAALMRYVLTSADRAYLVAAMRGVAANQRWGVWAAGPAQHPGNKDGWSSESDPYGKHWVTDTVGFAGPDERYTVAVMYQVGPAGSLADGVHAVSDVAALLFGAPVPARVTVPAPDG